MESPNHICTLPPAHKNKMEPTNPNANTYPKTNTQTIVATLVGDTLVGHSCRTHSFGKPLRDTHALLWDSLYDTHSCGKLLRNTLVGRCLVGHSCRTSSFVWHSCRTLSSVTLVGQSCMALTLVGHSCGTLLWHTLVGHSCTLVGHSCGALLQDTFVGHSCGALFRNTLVGLSCETPL